MSQILMGNENNISSSHNLHHEAQAITWANVYQVQ